MAMPSAERPRNAFLLHPAMTENYVVFIEQPIKMDLLKIVTCKLRGKALSDGIYWDPKQDTVFHLVDKQSGEVGCHRYRLITPNVGHSVDILMGMGGGGGVLLLSTL